MSQIKPASEQKTCGACNESYAMKDGHSCRPASPIPTPTDLKSPVLVKLTAIKELVEDMLSTEKKRLRAEAEMLS